MTVRMKGGWLGSLKRMSAWALTVALVLGIPGTGMSLAAASEAQAAALSIGSDPVGAQVYVDGKLRGETPLALDRVATGDHRVTVVKDGYLDNSRVVSVAAGQSSNL